MFAPSVRYFGQTFTPAQVEDDIREYFGRFWGVSYRTSDVAQSPPRDGGKITFRYKLHFQASYEAPQKPGQPAGMVKQRQGELPSIMVIEPHGVSWRIGEIGTVRR